MSPNLLLGLILFILAGLFLVTSRKIDVGYFNDDARYITAAYAITQGHYDNLELPGHPSNLDRLPGYPAILSPFVHLVKPNWSLLPITSIILTLLTSLLLYSAFADFMTPMQRNLLILLFGLNPTILKYSSSVMSEPCFLFFVVLTFVLFKTWLAHQKKRVYFLLFNIGLAWTLLIRPEGIALWAALLLVLAHKRWWRALFGVFAIPGFGVAALFLRNQRVNQSPTGYVAQWNDILAQVAGQYVLFLENGVRALKGLLLDSLWQIPFSPVSLGQFVIAALMGLVLFGVIVKGFLIQWQNLGHRKLLCLSMGLFVSFSVIIHCLFLSVNSRYYFSVIPFLLAWLIIGMKRWKAIGVLALLFVYTNPWTASADKLWGQTHSYRIPKQTLTWIRESTPPNAYLLAVKASTVHLYTDRFSISEVPAQDLEEFRYRLLQEGITHIFVKPARITVLSGKYFLNMLMIWTTASRWLPEWPEGFKKVHENAQEGTSVYAVIPDERYVQAYVLCRSADADFSAQKWEPGLLKLRKALLLYPHFPGALNRYGLALLMGYNDHAGAKEKFLQAVKLQPDFAFALINLAGLAQQAGESARTQDYRAQAREALEKFPSWSGDPERLKSIMGAWR